MVDEKRSRNIKSTIRKMVSTVQWQADIRPNWTVEDVRGAMYAHQTGNFERSSLLAEAMYADDEYLTALDKAVGLIVGSKFVLNPVQQIGTEEPDSESVRQAEAVEPLWGLCNNNKPLGELIRWYLQLGVAIGYLKWHTRGTEWLPRLHVLHPQFLYFDHERKNPWGGRGMFMYNSMEGIQEVTPGDGKWVMLGSGRHDWMRCAVRALAEPWIMKKYSLRDWARYNERHGLAIVKAHVPYSAEEEDKEAFFKDCNNLGTNTTALLPNNLSDENPEAKFDLDLLEATADTWETFQATIQRSDRKFQVYFNGTNTNELIGAAGSRNTTQTGRDIARERAAEFERPLSDELRVQIFTPFVSMNVPGADLSLVPKPHFQVNSDGDREQEARAGKMLADMVTQYQNAGWKVKNAPKLALDMGIEIEFDEEEAALKAKEREAGIESASVKVDKDRSSDPSDSKSRPAGQPMNQTGQGRKQ